ncbi:MAG: hypothetical protein R2729_19160 [Bryobacteraceae bacterium]
MADLEREVERSEWNAQVAGDLVRKRLRGLSNDFYVQLHSLLETIEEELIENKVGNFEQFRSRLHSIRQQLWDAPAFGRNVQERLEDWFSDPSQMEQDADGARLSKRDVSELRRAMLSESRLWEGEHLWPTEVKVLAVDAGKARLRVGGRLPNRTISVDLSALALPVAPGVRFFARVNINAEDPSRLIFLDMKLADHGRRSGAPDRP